MARSIHPPASQSIMRVFDAAIKDGLGKRVSRLPPHLLSRLESKLEGLQTPVKEKRKARFLSEVGELSARILEPAREEAWRASALMARKGYEPSLVEGEIRLLEERFELLSLAARAAMASSKPEDYLEFISRPGVDIARLLKTMGFFARGRGVDLKAVDLMRRKEALAMCRLASESSLKSLRTLLSRLEARVEYQSDVGNGYARDLRMVRIIDIIASMAKEPKALRTLLKADHRALIRSHGLFPLPQLQGRIAKAKESEEVFGMAHRALLGLGIYLTDTGMALRFGKTFRDGPIEGYILLKPERLLRYGYEGLTSLKRGDTTMLLALDRESTMQHELQHIFDKIAFIESTKMESEGDGGPDALLIDMEYRARLAEFVFTRSADLVEASMDEVLENAELEVPGEQEMSARILADRRVLERMGQVRKADGLKRRATRLLDQAYKQAYGLTYHQIVEPFNGLGEEDGTAEPKRK